jgi:hypothetical protein
MRLGISTFVASFTLLAGASPVWAQDMSRLANLLIPAYTAMYYASICATNTTWGQTQPQGARGTVVHYAEHIKNEIIQSLSQKDAVAVLTDAAGQARDLAREQLRLQVVMGSPEKHEQRLIAWCGGYVSDFAKNVISEHDKDHEAFLRTVEEAKRPLSKSENDQSFGIAARETAP